MPLLRVAAGGTCRAAQAPPNRSGVDLNSIFVGRLDVTDLPVPARLPCSTEVWAGLCGRCLWHIERVVMQSSPGPVACEICRVTSASTVEPLQCASAARCGKRYSVPLGPALRQVFQYPMHIYAVSSSTLYPPQVENKRVTSLYLSQFSPLQ